MGTSPREAEIRYFLMDFVHRHYSRIRSLCGGLSAAGVQVRFDPARPDVGPFPTDFLTVADSTQITGQRVNMPMPDCARERATCSELSVINQYDGFSLLPRIHVRFSAAVNPNTLAGGIFLLWLDKLDNGEQFSLGPTGMVTPINEVVYDPQTNTAYAKPDDFFDQDRRYAVIVTDAVRDTEGTPVVADPGFQSCVAGAIGGDYCAGVGKAIAIASRSGRFAGRGIVGASVFTTMSATSFSQRARANLEKAPPAFQRTGARNTFMLRNIQSLVWVQQVRTSGDQFRNAAWPLPPVLLAQAGLDRVAFGSFRSPNYLNASQVIDITPSAQDLPLPASAEIFFEAFLPAAPPPPNGYPVVIAGHGFTDSQYGMPLATALLLVPKGYAVVAINAVGHGFGPSSALRITERDGTITEFPSGGRGADLVGNGEIASGEGCVVLNADSAVGSRDCLRQTALDLSQLTRAIRAGMDIAGDGRPDLDGDRVFYLGQSLGSFYGTLFEAIDPDSGPAVLNVGGGSTVQASRLSTGLRPLLQAFLRGAHPTLLNAGTDFRENLPLRYEPVRVNNVPGAIELQDLFERAEWIETPGAPYAFATHLRSATLPGVPIKPVLFQFAVGDQTVPNPANTQLIRAANSRDTSVLYRHDLARSQVPELSAIRTRSW